MPPNEKKIWFPAKRYGWGWGPPLCWQGWAVVIGWVILDAAGVILLARHLVLVVAWFAALLLALMAVCWLKGEKPFWRWGGK